MIERNNEDYEEVEDTVEGCGEIVIRMKVRIKVAVESEKMVLIMTFCEASSWKVIEAVMN